MKLLLVNNDKGWGGGQEYLKDLAVELRKSGVDVHFVVRAGSLSAERFARLDFPVYAMPHHGFRDMQAILKLATILRRERFDIISINREHDIFMTVLARRLAFPLARSGRLLMSYHIGIARRQHFLGAMDAIICVSEHVRSRLLQYHPGVASKTCVLHHVIGLSDLPGEEKFSLGRARRFFHGAVFPLIGMVGAFWKNQGELVDCIPLLKRRFPGIRVAFVGDNTDLPLAVPLIEKIKRMGLEKSVIFTGKVPREKVADIFFDLDLSVTTHRNEGFGLVHLESLAAGTPVVAYNVGGQVDILQGTDAGVLVEGGPAQFAEAVTGLLINHGKRFAMGGEGVKLVDSTFSMSAMGSRYLVLFAVLTGNCAGEGRQ